ncbi:MAG: transketolase [Firmicutes bacterium]|nr:transketolase [Bacillota bacterium]
MEVKKLEGVARLMRSDILRMTNAAGSGHPGGSLSAVELVAGLYFGGVINVDPKRPEWKGRDYFILSKGHAGPVLYSALARRGFFPMKELLTLRKYGSILQGHPHRDDTPGLDSSSGSLGQGLSISNGLALAFKKQNMKNRVYCLMGDGELQEGQVWEAIMFAAQHGLDNVCAMVDYNHVQLDDTLENIKALGDLTLKFKAFGWNVVEIDGHNFESVLGAYEMARCCKGKPTVIVANTIKGKGVSFMEGDCAWHGKAPSDEELRKALEEINTKKGGAK